MHPAALTLHGLRNHLPFKILSPRLHRERQPRRDGSKPCGTTIIATRHPPPRLTSILATAANTSYKMGCPCTALKSPRHAFWKPIIYQLSLPKSALEGFAAETGKGASLHQSISRTEVSYHPEYMQFLEAISHCQEDIPALQRSTRMPATKYQHPSCPERQDFTNFTTVSPM